MTVVVLPNGDEVEFPGGMSDQDIRDAIERNFPQYRRESAITGAPGFDVGAAQPPSLLRGGPSFDELSTPTAPAPPPDAGGGQQRRGGLRREFKPYIAGEGNNPVPKAKEKDPWDILSPPPGWKPSEADLEFQKLPPQERARRAQAALARMGIFPPEQGPSISALPAEALSDKWGRKARDYLSRNGISAPWSAVNQAAGDAASLAGDAAMTANKGIAMGAGLAFKAADLLTLGAVATDDRDESLFSRSAQLADAIGNAATANQSYETRRQIEDLGSANGFWDAAGKLARNPRALLDMAASSGGGSMAVSRIAARGGGRLAVGIAASRGIQDAETLAKIYAAGSEWGSGMGNVFMNAGDTFSDTDADLSGKLKAAVIAAAGTKVADKMFHGGAEAALARGAQGYKEAFKTFLHEPSQEVVESLSQSAGKATGEGRALDVDKASGQALIEAAAATPTGGVTALHMARESSRLPPVYSAEDVARSKGFLVGRARDTQEPARRGAGERASPTRVDGAASEGDKGPPPPPSVFASSATDAAGLPPVVVNLPGPLSQSGVQPEASTGAKGQEEALPAESPEFDDAQRAAAAARVVDQATRAPGSTGIRPLSRDQIEQPLATLEARAERGTLTPEWFFSSPIAQRLDIETAKAFNQALRADPVAAARALREQFDASAAASDRVGAMDTHQAIDAAGAEAQTPGLNEPRVPVASAPVTVAGATFHDANGPLDADRKPLVLYPMSSGSGAASGASSLVRLTSNRETAEREALANGDPQMPAPQHAAVRRPYIADVAFWNGLRDASPQRMAEVTRELRAQGHDGIAFANPDGSFELMPFDPAQVRDAPGASRTGRVSVHRGEFHEQRPAKGLFPILSRGLRAMKVKILPASMWREMIRQLSRRGPVEAREIKLSRVLDRLDKLVGPMTVQQVERLASGASVFSDGSRSGMALHPKEVEFLQDWVKEQREIHRGESLLVKEAKASHGAATALSMRLSQFLGRPVLFVKIDGHTTMNAANVVTDPQKTGLPARKVTVINVDADDSILALAIHEAVHGLPSDLKHDLLRNLRLLISDEARQRFKDEHPTYAGDPDAYIDEEIAAFLAQGEAKYAPFWMSLARKLGDDKFSRLAQAIIDMIDDLMWLFRGVNGGVYVSNLQKGRELVTDALAEMIRRQQQPAGDTSGWSDRSARFEAWYGVPLEGVRHAIADPSPAAASSRGDPGTGAVERRGVAAGDTLQRRGELDANPGGATPVTVAKATFTGASGPVGADQKPLVVYHGTRHDIAAFDLNHPGRKDHGWLGRGVYLTSSPETAEFYARAKRGPQGPALMPLYANVRRPFVADARFRKEMRASSPERVAAQTQRLREQGYDGVAFEHDDGSLELVAFDASQVKSAVGNNGGFDAHDDRVNYSDLAGSEQPSSLAGRDEARRGVGDEGASGPQGGLSDTPSSRRSLGAKRAFPVLAGLVRGVRDRVLAASLWRDRAKSWLQRSPVEAQELRQSGLLEWLASQDGDLTREQVLGHLHLLGDEATHGGEQHGDAGKGQGLSPKETAAVIRRVQDASDFSDRARDEPDIGEALMRRIDEDFDGLVREYAALPGSMEGRLLDVDVARELSPHYRADRSRASEVHDAASEFVSRLYAQRMAAEGDGSVVLMAGGSGAGKSSAQELLGPLLDDAQTILDGTLSAKGRAVERVREALTAGRTVQVVYVYRDPVRAFVEGVIPRAMETGRPVPVDAVARTHAGASATVNELQRLFGANPRFQVVAIDNSGARGNARLMPLQSITRINIEGLASRLREEADKALQAGALSAKLHQAMVAPRARQGRRGHDTREATGARSDTREAPAADPRLDGPAAEAGRDAGDGRQVHQAGRGAQPQDPGVLQGRGGPLGAGHALGEQGGLSAPSNSHQVPDAEPHLAADAWQGGQRHQTSEAAEGGGEAGEGSVADPRRDRAVDEVRHDAQGNQAPLLGASPGRVEIRANRHLSKSERKKLKQAVARLLESRGGLSQKKKPKFDFSSDNIGIVNLDEAGAETLRRFILAVAQASVPGVHWQGAASDARAVTAGHAADERNGDGASGGVETAGAGDRPKPQGLLSRLSRHSIDALKKIRGMQSGERWKAGEQFVRRLVGSAGSAHFHVPPVKVAGEEIKGSGGRHVDAIEYREDGTFVAHEVKTYGLYYTDANGMRVTVEVPLDAEIKEQVLKDAWLAANVKGYTAFWHFLGAPPSKALQDFLAQHSIKYEIYKEAIDEPRAS